jgi:hypothetical protein
VEKYLRNPFVLIGSVGIIYWFWKRNKIMKSQPNANDSIDNLDSASQFTGTMLEDKAKKFGVPTKLIKDTQKMSKRDVAKTIISNQQMLNATEMSNDERSHILKMVAYLEYELDRKK